MHMSGTTSHLQVKLKRGAAAVPSSPFPCDDRFGEELVNHPFVERLGRRHKRFAERLEIRDLLRAAEAALGNPVQVDRGRAQI